jgi:glutamine amidotransferase
MIAIIDYGMGNLKSLQNSLQYLGKSSVITREEKKVNESDYIILPGVGSFNLAMKYIKNYSLDIILRNEVFIKKKPLLGICLGMQLLADFGEEDGGAKGLGMIRGEVLKIKHKSAPLPHMGYNLVEWKNNFPSNQKNFYFVHSYQFIPKNKDDIVGVTKYDDEIISAVKNQNIVGLQFHPEKSQSDGLILLNKLIENKNYA